METPLYNQEGDKIGTAELPVALFDVAFKDDVVHEVLQAQLANARHPIAHTKGRGEVRGGGKKPWRQKGTGRARHASIRSPIWKGGGVAFGPTKERNFSKKVNKKLARKALAMVLSSKVRDGEFRLVDAFALSKPKTKEAVAVLKKLQMPYSVVVVTPMKDRLLERAMRNIQRVEILAADSLNIKDILKRKHLIMVQSALPVLSDTYKIK